MWIDQSFTCPFDVIATHLQPHLDATLLNDTSITDFLPDAAKAIISDPVTHHQIRTRWLLDYVDKSQSKEMQDQFLQWMGRNDALLFLVKPPPTCPSSCNYSEGC